MPDRGTELVDTWSDESLVATLRHHPAGETLRHVISEAETEAELCVPEGTGGFVLGDCIGRGGFADVFLAHQPSLDRTIAIKRIRSRDPSSSVQRFVHEARITARLNHRNILPIHDLVSVDGHPALVMKAVDGVSWSEQLASARAENRLDLGAEVKRLLQVSHAVAFAHSRGVVHLDLKPANVMLGDGDETLVMDWGCAALMDSDGWDAWTDLPLAEKIRAPRGTPIYMAPELAMGRGADISPATDVFLLGAILFGLLTGEPLRKGFDTLLVLEMARTASLPVLPDTVDPVLGALCLEALEPHPARRLGSVAAVADRLQGWLDTRESRALTARAEVRLTALTGLVELTAEQRREAVGLLGVFEQAGRGGSGLDSAIEAEWATRRMLAEDALRRKEPGLAREFALPLPDDHPWRARLLKRVVVASQVQGLALRSARALRVVLVLSVVGGIAALSAVMTSRELAEQERERFEAQMSFTTELLQSVGVAEDLGLDPTLVLKVLSDTEEKVREQYADQPVQQAELWSSMGQAYLAVEQTEKGLRYLELAMNRLESSHGLLDPLTVSSVEALGKAYLQHDREADADALLTSVLMRLEARFGEEAPETLEGRGRIAEMRREWGRYEEAYELQQGNWTLRRAQLGENHPDTLASEYEVCRILWEDDRLEEALPVCEHVLEAQRRVLGTDHKNTIISAHTLGLLHWARGERSEALVLIRGVLKRREAALGFENLQTLYAAQNLALVLRDDGRYTEAVELLQRVLPQLRLLEGPSGFSTQVTRNNLGLAWMGLERYPEAEVHLRTAYELRVQEQGVDAPRSVLSARSLGRLMLELGRLDEAESLLEQARRASEAVYGPDHGTTLVTRSEYARLLAVRGRTEEAQELAQVTYDEARRERTADAPVVTRCLEALVDVSRWTGDDVGAHAQLTELRKLQAASLGTDHPATLRTVSHSVDTLLALGRPVEASALRSDWLHRVETMRQGARPRPEQLLWLDRIEAE